MIEDIAYREKIDKNQLVIHSDNGSPMKGATLRAKMIDLEIASSYSRPRVSNDNPYSESLFKTIKYHYSFPEKTVHLKITQGKQGQTTIKWTGRPRMK